MASAESTIDDQSTDERVVLDIDGSLYCDTSREIFFSTDKFSWFGMKRLSLDATSHTAKIQFAVETGVGATTSIMNARICALRLDGFFNSYSNENFTRQTITGTTVEQTALTDTFNPLTADHLVIGACVLDYSNAGLGRWVVGTMYDSGGAIINNFDYHVDEAGDTASTFGMTVQPLVPGTKNYTWKWNIINVSDVGGIDEITLISIQLTENTGSLEPVGQIVM
jgi:hypothetical protein